MEQFKVLLLNRANRVLGVYELSTGGVAGTVSDPKLVFVAVLKACASGIILSHNHPSGNLKPRQADLQLTRKIKQGGELLDISLVSKITACPDPDLLDSSLAGVSPGNMVIKPCSS